MFLKIKLLSFLRISEHDDDGEDVTIKFKHHSGLLERQEKQSMLIIMCVALPLGGACKSQSQPMFLTTDLFHNPNTNTIDL